jgi:hypothetical protein
MLTGSCHCGRSVWTLEGDPGVVTACNCTLCRRYGVLWAYDFKEEHIRLPNPTHSYVRPDKPRPQIEILFCPTCANVIAWRALSSQEDGRRRAAVNVRLAHPEAVADLAVEHLDGLKTFEPLPSDGRRVRYLWF